MHNKVNVRLAKDHAADQDPAHPKLLFPSQSQCAKCQTARVVNDDVQNTENFFWNTDEVLSFMVSFYSKNHIVSMEPIKTNLDEFQIDEPDTKGAAARKDSFADDAGSSYAHSSDFKLMAILLLIILTTFAVMYIFFNYLKRKPKLKKHII